tara:strand:+ start:126 stop:338 length:213 start_codon:yes stop_codon:yes gene_type:complete
MKTKIVIQDGKSKIVLTCENEFEKDLIEKIKDSRIGYETNTHVLTDYRYSAHSNHRIEIDLIERINKGVR